MLYTHTMLYTLQTSYLFFITALWGIPSITYITRWGRIATQDSGKEQLTPSMEAMRDLLSSNSRVLHLPITWSTRALILKRKGEELPREDQKPNAQGNKANRRPFAILLRVSPIRSRTLFPLCSNRLSAILHCGNVPSIIQANLVDCRMLYTDITVTDN